MSSPILSTKLYIPKLKPNTVRRDRLFDILNEGRHRKLTLVSASAGFGKTTLISEWLNFEKIRAAWISADSEHSDPLRFVSYLIASIQIISEDIGAELSTSIRTANPPPTESIIGTLLNELDAAGCEFTLIIDDYHLIDNREVDGMVNLLVDQLPPGIHLIIITREDPGLPLSRLRAGDHLTELRSGDLRFNAVEAGEFLNGKSELALSQGEVSALENRTEGWIAGLQLAAISMKKKKDISGFIKTFTGNHYLISDYLVDEVLNQQPENIQRFLLCTSVLERLSSQLCDALAGEEAESSGQAMLEYLEQANIFVIPLDDERRWYRYHHLFSHILYQRLERRSREDGSMDISDLHARASRWYERNGFEREAVEHSFSAGNHERAAELLEKSLPAFDAQFQSGIWLKWVRTLPEEIIKKRPVLSVGYAQALMDAGEYDDVQSPLADAENCLQGYGSGDHDRDIVFIDKEQFSSLPATIANVRAYRALAVGDPAGALVFAREALALSREEDYLKKGIASAFLGLAHWSNGDLHEAYRILSDGVDAMRKAGNHLFVIGSATGLVEIREDQGDLKGAIGICHETLELARSLDESGLWVSQNIHLALCHLHMVRNDLEAANKHMEMSEKLAEHSVLSDWPYRAAIVRAGILEMEGSPEASLKMLEKAETLYIRNPAPNRVSAGVLKVRLWIKMGFLNMAREWFEQKDISVGDSLGFLREFEHITMIRLLLAEFARGRRDEALASAMVFIDRLYDASETGKRKGSLIELLVLKSIAYKLNNDGNEAIRTLEKALKLAEPQGYVKVFSDERSLLSELLEEALKSVDREYGIKVMASLKGRSDSSMSQPLIEPLSQRELEVLELIGKGLSNHEIGDRLYLALSTVKGYNQRIFGKLDVKRRTEAVSKARELGIIPK